VPSWPSMSRIALGAMHSAILHSPAHTWFVIFIYNTEEDCVEEYMHAELYTTGDKIDNSTFSTLSLSVHVYRPSTIVNSLAWSYHSFQPCNYNNFDHCHREAYSDQPTLPQPSLSTTRFRSLQQSVAKLTLHPNRLWCLASNFAYTLHYHKLRNWTTIRVN
jgi:hypothetical protein